MTQRHSLSRLLRSGGHKPVAGFLSDFWDQRVLADAAAADPYIGSMTDRSKEIDDELTLIRADIEEVRNPTAECPACHQRVGVNNAILQRHALATLDLGVETYCKGSGARL